VSQIQSEAHHPSQTLMTWRILLGCSFSHYFVFNLLQCSVCTSYCKHFWKT
jgi:hypothetical protein